MVALGLKNTRSGAAPFHKSVRVADASPRLVDAAQRERHADCMDEIARNKSRPAFAELFAFFAPRVKNYMMRLGASDSEAEDLAQDVLVTVWQKAALYDRTQASVSTWIFRVARNRRIDAHRRTRKPDLEPHEPMLLPPEIEQPDCAVARGQMEGKVQAELVKLPPDQLALLRAAFYDGLSHSEIAKAFNLPLGTVKSRIRLAFLRLRGELDSAL